MAVFKYELHVHDNACSRCAHNTPEEMAAAYRRAGYSGMCFTNHFLRGNTAVDKRPPWAEKMRAYWNAYERAVKSTAGTDFTVFFGLEHMYGDGKEVLTYGIDLDFLLANPGLDALPLSEYAARVHAAGGFLSQAHPFRTAPYINPDVLPQTDCLDAVEGFNFFNRPEENRRAVDFAKQHGLYMTSGGDTHSRTEESIGMAGMAFPYRIESGRQLAEALHRHDGTPIINGRI